MVEAKRRHTDVREVRPKVSRLKAEDLILQAGEKALEVIRGGTATQDTFIRELSVWIPSTVELKPR